MTRGSRFTTQSMGLALAAVSPCSSNDEPSVAFPFPGCCTPSAAAGSVVASVRPRLYRSAP